MKIALWTVQVLLAAVFLMAGLTKALTPLPELATQMAFVTDVPAFIPRLAGVAEIFGALGLVLPAATRIKPGLTPLAASGLGLIMVLAAGLHLSRGEWGSTGVNLALLALAAFVGIGRTRFAPVEPRRASPAREAQPA